MRFYVEEVVSQSQMKFIAQIPHQEFYDGLTQPDLYARLREYIYKHLPVKSKGYIHYLLAEHPAEEFYDVDLKIVEIEHGEWDLTFHVMATATKKDETL